MQSSCCQINIVLLINVVRHIGKRCYHWFHLSLFGFAGCFLVGLLQQSCLKWKMIFIMMSSQWTCFFLYILLHLSKCKGFFNVYSNRWMCFFNYVSTWHREWKALEVLFCQFYIHFIGRDCQWHYCVHMWSLFWDTLLQ